MKEDKRKPLILPANTTISLEIPADSNETMLLEDVNETILLEDANKTVLLSDANETVLLADANETVLLSESNETVLLSNSNETVPLDEMMAKQSVKHSRELYQLSEGEMLADRYVIGDILGFGGFGITYSAWDTKLEVKVAIKEYYPANLVNRVPGTKTVEIYSSKKQAEFDKGLNRFLGEAQNMAKFSGQKNIVNVYNYFKENKTAYLVMEFLDGVSLKEYTRMHGEKLPYKQVIEFTKCVISALRVLHKKHIIHRDISPDNIFICKDGNVKLIDFGAARFASETDEAKTLSVVLKPGFAPPEQYRSKGKQGSWTDIYALGATMYRTVTGIVPEESVNRNVKDELKEPKEYVSDIPEYLNKILMKCLALDSELRFQNVDELEQKIDKKKVVKSVQAQLRQRKLMRRVLIGMILVALGLFGFAEYNYIRSVRDKANLVPGTITVWVPIAEGMDADSMQEMFESSIEDFKETYPTVEVEAAYIPLEEYGEKVNEVIGTKEAPTVFQSSFIDGYNEGFLDESMQDLFADVTEVYDLMDVTHMKFGTFLKNMFEGRVIPTGFSVPIIFENTMLTGESAIYTEKNDKQSFLEGKSTVYIGTYKDYKEIQEALAGIYTASMVEGEIAEFLNAWSVNANADEDERNAGARLLYYLISEEAQDIWYIQNESGFPMQTDTIETYTTINSELSFINDIGLSERIVEELDEECLENIYQSIVNKEGE